MFRMLVLIAVNFMIAIAMAASVLPVVIVAVPAIRETPAAGYATFAGAAALFASLNLVFWSWWRRP